MGQAPAQHHHPQTALHCSATLPLATHLAKAHGLTTWPKLMATPPGQSSWPHHLAKAHGHTTWPKLMATPPGQSSWPAERRGDRATTCPSCSHQAALPSCSWALRPCHWTATTTPTVYPPQPQTPGNVAALVMDLLKGPQGEGQQAVTEEVGWLVQAASWWLVAGASLI